MKTCLTSLLAALILTGAAAGAQRFACNLNALDKTELARHGQLAKAMWADLAETRELPNGYAFRFPPNNLMTAAEWVSLERRCCPFFTIELSLSHDDGPLWVRVTGEQGVKDFIRAERGL